MVFQFIFWHRFYGMLREPGLQNQLRIPPNLINNSALIKFGGIRNSRKSLKCVLLIRSKRENKNLNLNFLLVPEVWLLKTRQTAKCEKTFKELTFMKSCDSITTFSSFEIHFALLSIYRFGSYGVSRMKIWYNLVLYLEFGNTYSIF